MQFYIILYVIYLLCFSSQLQQHILRTISIIYSMVTWFRLKSKWSFAIQPD